MKSSLYQLRRKLYNAFVPDKVTYNDLILPGRHLRTGGVEFQGDGFFVESANSEVQRLIDQFGINSGSRLLDVGCGYGRLAIGLQSKFPTIHYSGIDVNEMAINWCKKYIGVENPNYEFQYINVENPRYNPAGSSISAEFRLPFSTNQFSTAYLYSVFSHMLSSDVITYLNELSRMVSNEGEIFFTAFAEKDVPEVSVNPPDYGDIEWKHDLHCVRYNYDYLLNIIEGAGLRLDQFEYGLETNGQSAFYVSVGHK